MRRPSRRQLKRVADVAIPVLVTLFLLSLVDTQAPDQPWWVTTAGLLAATAQGVALVWRRTRPELVMAITVAGCIVIHAIAPFVVFPISGLFALGSLAAARPPRVSLIGLVALLGVTSINYWTATSADASFAMCFPVVVWAMGEVVRNRREAVAQATRRAIGDEQARIARELHDVIAHSVSVIVVQAAAADDVFDERPDQARAALRSIETAGREALTELRRLLAGVATGQPGLAQLGDLAAPLRAAGLEVAVHDEAEAPLPAGLDLSAYRIVQEALTNTLRHAGASRAEVTVRAAAGRLELDVRDDGRGNGNGGGAGGGRGIAGMRERAALLGGTLEAGPLPDGGFRVHASLPLEAAR